MSKDKLKISYTINIITVILVIAASVIMFTGFNLMGIKNPLLVANRIVMMRYFTVDSNMLVGLASLLFAIEERKKIKDGRRIIPTGFYIFKFVATVAVSVTFLTVFLYLGPASDGGIKSMLVNSNLFFHLIIPVLCIFNFTFLERTNKIDKKYILYGLLPTILYSLFYLVNILLHVENSKVSTEYDWYWFVQNGLWMAVIIIPVMLIFTYLIK